MGIISKNNRSYLGARLKLAQNLQGGKNGRYVRVTCTSNEAGKQVRDVMKQYWPELGSDPNAKIHFEYMRSNEGNGQAAWNNWEIFSVVPYGPSKQANADACAEIANELSGIIEGVSDGSVKPNETTYDPDPTDPIDPDDAKKTKLADYTTYIIIGAAAVIILLLLWDRRKK